MYYVEFQGLRLIAVASNLAYLCFRLLNGFRWTEIVRVYSYPDCVLLAVIHNSKIQYHFKEDD